MSWNPCERPHCSEAPTSKVQLLIDPKPKDIGAFEVRRCLPTVKQRSVGPFVFFDEMGPAELEPGAAMSVRPHPHINLATITYLFEGEIMHRDSLGFRLPIQPGAVNLMVAGQGIVHSERSPEEGRDLTRRLHGLQLWLGLPEHEEERPPSFHHHPADIIPSWSDGAARRTLIMGTFDGRSSPVETFSPTHYEVIEFGASGEVELAEAEERAIYVVEGTVWLGDQSVGPHQMAVLGPGVARVRSEGDSRVALIGGERLGPRFMDWNFVSSRKERIEAARDAWRAGEFPKVPGDDSERIPYPGDSE